tara:strand:+ start:45 stop:218 length:174 start_codon:yes stop_codon:yes gene_type:complete
MVVFLALCLLTSPFNIQKVVFQASLSIAMAIVEERVVRASVINDIIVLQFLKLKVYV